MNNRDLLRTRMAHLAEQLTKYPDVIQTLLWEAYYSETFTFLEDGTAYHVSGDDLVPHTIELIPKQLNENISHRASSS